MFLRLLATANVLSWQRNGLMHRYRAYLHGMMRTNDSSGCCSNYIKYYGLHLSVHQNESFAWVSREKYIPFFSQLKEVEYDREKLERRLNRVSNRLADEMRNFNRNFGDRVGRY